MTFNLFIGAALISLSATAHAFDPINTAATGGVLDEPLTNPNVVSPVTLIAPGLRPLLAPTVSVPFDVPAHDPDLSSPNAAIRQEAVRNAVEEEIEVLEALPAAALEARAEAGERAAQVVLGSEFAREAQSLYRFPAAANQAAEDAVRWYSLAARRGFPGAASLDYAGVSFYPVRVQRAAN